MHGGRDRDLLERSGLNRSGDRLRTMAARIYARRRDEVRRTGPRLRSRHRAALRRTRVRRRRRGRRSHRLARPARTVPRPAGAVGLRQVDPAAADRGSRSTDPRRDRRRPPRRGSRRKRPGRRRSPTSSRTPTCCRGATCSTTWRSRSSFAASRARRDWTARAGRSSGSVSPTPPAATPRSSPAACACARRSRARW